MIDTHSLSAEWIAEKRKKYCKDPTLMESMIHALYLLEKIHLTGLDFIFKGGTSLILIMEEPKRFSIDIDILISPKINRELVEKFLSRVTTESKFIRMELDEGRSYQGDILKAHYRFIYISNFANKNKEGKVISNPEREILLDILFADNYYPVIIEKKLNTEWLMQTGEAVKVKMPDINSITGDKLTAFAPNTTGVLYKSGKEKEIIKQLFDVGCLIHLLTDLHVLKKSFKAAAINQIAYRPERNIETVEKVLSDTIETALLIARKDILIEHDEKEIFSELHRGINQFSHFVYDGTFGVLEAQVASAKAAYLAAVIIKDFKGELKSFSKEIPLDSYLIRHLDYNYLNKRLKFVSKGEALYYWFHTIKLLFPESKTFE